MKTARILLVVLASMISACSTLPPDSPSLVGQKDSCARALYCKSYPYVERDMSPPKVDWTDRRGRN